MSRVVEDRSLRLQVFDATADIEPDDVLYQRLDADSSSDNGYTFFIRAPAPNALLDNEVWMEYRLTLSGTGVVAMGENPVVNGIAIPYLRGGYCLNKAIGALTLTLNGQNFSHRPYLWQNVLERLYFSNEEAEVLLSVSGGAFDTGPDHSATGLCSTGTHTTLAFDAAIVTGNNSLQTSIFPENGIPVLTVAPNGANGDKFLRSKNYPGTFLDHEGQGKRLAQLWEYIRTDQNLNGLGGAAPATAPSLIDNAAANVATANAANRIEIKIFEKLPIFPFKCFDNKEMKMSIPNIRDMTIQCTWSRSSFKSLICNATGILGGIAAPTDAQILVSVTQEKPVIHMKWFTTKIPIPPSVMLPAYIIREYEERAFENYAVLNATWETQTKTFTGRTINLESIPDLFLIYYAVDPGQRTMQMPDSMHLEIIDLRIHIGGSSGRMNNISQQELYCMWLRNVRHNGTGRLSYIQWRKYHCVAALRPRDIGITWGPGFNYPVQIQVQVTVRNNYNLPVFKNSLQNNLAVPVGLNWNQYTICTYDRMAYQINQDGSSRLEMMKLPLQPVQPQESAEMQQPTNSQQSLFQV